MDPREAQILKWQKWNKEREVTKNLGEIGVDIDQESKGQEYLAQLTLKIAENRLGPVQPAQNNNNQEDIEQIVCREVEANTCAICFELMVPPLYSPILLFPCGHTFCKQCTLDKSSKLKITKCPLCRQRIQSSAVNISLQNLITTVTSKKQEAKESKQVNTTPKQSTQESDTDFTQQCRLYEMRCDILMEEKAHLQKEVNNLADDLETTKTVVDSLKIEKQLLQNKMDQLIRQMQNIEELLDQNMNNAQEIQNKLNQAKKQQSLIDETLGPLRNELKKYQILSQNK